MNEYQDILEKTGVIPVAALEDAASAAPLAKALQAGGISALEVTFRTQAAAESIQRIAKGLPELFVCAGTILTPEQAHIAVESGAKAIISPGTNPQVVEWCQRHGVPVIPGCATPTEIEQNLRFGLTLVKLFPAQAVGGVPLLKALMGPYAQMRFMPTGGISPNNLKDYLSLPNVLACGGSWLCSKADINAQNWQAITDTARECSALVAEIRAEG